MIFKSWHHATKKQGLFAGKGYFSFSVALRKNCGRRKRRPEQVVVLPH